MPSGKLLNTFKARVKGQGHMPRAGTRLKPYFLHVLFQLGKATQIYHLPFVYILYWLSNSFLVKFSLARVNRITLTPPPPPLQSFCSFMPYVALIACHISSFDMYMQVCV